MKQLIIKATLLEDALALLPGTPDSFSRFLEYKKAKLNKQQAAHVEDMEEEEKRAIKERLETLKIDQTENSVSVFPIDKETGKPFYYDYQIRGFFKDAARGLKDCLQIKKSKAAGEDNSKEDNPDAKLKKALSKCKYLASFAGFSKMPATWVDRGIFVGPRNVLIEMPEGSKIGFCERPLRVEKFPQPIVSIKCSECVPAGSVLKFKVGILNDADEKFVLACLHYGFLRGFGEWRNSGKGRFSFEIYDETKKRWVYQTPEFESVFGFDEALPE